MTELAEFVTFLEDSRRWRHLELRSGDIVVCTPPKSGTTWMQGIVHSLLWPAGDAPGHRRDIAPWIDFRRHRIETIVELLDAQDHRRSIKSHSPANCIPYDPEARYIVVYRDGRDALMSWENHRIRMRPDAVKELNALAAIDGVAPVDLTFEGDRHRLYEEWLLVCSPLRHLASWWPRRHEPNVLFVHYADLSSDLVGEMKRIAGFLDLDLAEEQWPDVVDRCTLDSMREDGRNTGMERLFIGGSDGFFHKGGSGRWQGVIPEDIVDDYMQRAVTELPRNAASWLEHGSRVHGIYPDQEP